MNRHHLLVTAASALATLAVPAAARAGATADPVTAARDALYGEVPLAAFAASNGKTAYPWTSLRAAAAAIAAGDHARATPLLHRVATDAHVEPLTRLEAWTALRQLNALPTPAEAGKFEGVVVEVILLAGRDTLAAYADKSAVYISPSGQRITLLPGGVALVPQIDALLAAGRTTQRRIGPWMSAQTPALPYNGGARVTILTAWGISFGQGPIDSISQDPRSELAFNAANTLLQAMVARANAPATGTGRG